MGTPGVGVLKNGYKALSSTGHGLLYNAAGECPECCDDGGGEEECQPGCWNYIGTTDLDDDPYECSDGEGEPIRCCLEWEMSEPPFSLCVDGEYEISATITNNCGHSAEICSIGIGVRIPAGTGTILSCDHESSAEIVDDDVQYLDCGIDTGAECADPFVLGNGASHSFNMTFRVDSLSDPEPLTGPAAIFCAANEIYYAGGDHGSAVDQYSRIIHAYEWDNCDL